MKRPQLIAFLAIALLSIVASLGGCASYSYSPLQIQPLNVKKAAIVPKFSKSYYYYDRDQTLYFVMRTSTTDPATRKPVEQIFTARIFWRPIGGVTSLNTASLNATYRYVLMTPDSVGLYEGAGFVRLTGKNGKKSIRGQLMDGDLRLTQASNSFVDTLGRAHIKGSFTAEYDDIKAFDMLMDAHREFFARSLLSKPGPEATRPGGIREEGAGGFPIPLEPGAEPQPGPIVAPPATQP